MFWVSSKSKPLACFRNIEENAFNFSLLDISLCQQSTEVCLYLFASVSKLATCHNKFYFYYFEPQRKITHTSHYSCVRTATKQKLSTTNKNKHITTKYMTSQKNIYNVPLHKNSMLFRLSKYIIKLNNALPREDGSTVTSILFSATGLRVSLPIRLNSINLGTFVTFPFFFTMFSAKMFLNSSKVTKCPRGMMMNTCWLRANIGFFLVFFVVPLLQFPWKIMTSPMKLKILVPLKTLVTNLTHKSIRC